MEKENKNEGTLRIIRRALEEFLLEKKKENIAFIDGQNLYKGTFSSNWKVSFEKLRIYLKDKYHVSEAYYFLGYFSESQKDLHCNLQKAGFTLLFKEHNASLTSNKKGNVDADIIFESMKHLIENTNFGKIILVSGDGDYKKLVDYLISKERFEKILFPNKQFASSLYRQLGSEYYDYMENIRVHIEFINEKGS
jgi:uncharacterized LabA/DUF88 family protein